MYEELLKGTIQNYSLDGIYEEIENFSEITSDLIEKIRSTSLLTNANAYLTNLSS